MKVFQYLFFFFFLIAASKASNHTSKECEEKEKPFALFDIAKNVLTKVKLIAPNCDERFNISHPNNSACGGKGKAAAFVDVILGLIEDAKAQYHNCKSNNDTNLDRDPNKKPIDKPTEIPEVITTEIQEVITTEVPEVITTEVPDEKPEHILSIIDCSELKERGFNESGVYTTELIKRDGVYQNRSLDLYCDMDTESGGWTVIQRRDKYPHQENFYRDWETYKKGFGHITKDFWLGNDIIYIMSNQGQYEIRFEIQKKYTTRKYAAYRNFRLENEINGYKIHISGYYGTAGDAMDFHNGMKFSTFDRKNDLSKDTNCAKNSQGAWWYNNCYHCNPNGVYQPGTQNDLKSAIWYEKTTYEGFAFSEIKIRRKMIATNN